ncbi:S-adenosylmethionine synthase [Candidatus Methanoperedenaceae archaeon GB50]|nr:MAG: S-adenosylmethionine synthase [Candidatus Methanoperedenaceae archaeon GB50]CAD7775753.1 S-adenosylmethionine synthase [Candidatus Methanoperedenaceae archaeon GB50]
MKRNIIVEKISERPIEDQAMEIVERKGVGHPDSIADGIAEAASRALCNLYEDECGMILHHNTDQVEIVAGSSAPEYGGGKLISPIYVLLNGRATKEFEGTPIPTDTTVIGAARKYLEETLLNIDLERHVILDCRIGSGSTDLQNVFKRGEVPLANDTSFGVGFAPLSETEELTYNTERFMIEELRRKGIPAIGEDVKVMGFRENETISLTIACAMVGRYVDDLDAYISIKEEIAEKVLDMAVKYTERDVRVMVNTADDLEAGSVYLTVTGTSAEMGDDGSVGRGNRCNGLITPWRPMSMEATSGKNPINHSGKIYNLLSNEMAREIAEEVRGVEDVYIRILSRIGYPIDQPLVASAQVVPSEGAKMNLIERETTTIMDRWLEEITSITEMIVEGRIKTF